MKKNLIFALILALVVLAGCGAAESVDKPYLSEQGAAMGKVNNEYVSAEYYNLRVEMYRLSGSDQPYTDAWEATIKEVCEFEFAEENGLLPTVKEVQKQVDKEQKEVEAAADSKQSVEILLAQLGLTWDEYWTEYKPQELAAQLVKDNVSAYLQKNGQTDLDYSDVEAYVMNQSVLDSLLAEMEA